MAKELVERDLSGLTEEPARTVGEKLYLRHGITGVRGQLEAGLPAVQNVGLPVLERGLEQGKSLNDAGCAALLAILAAETDTNMIARGGLAVQRETAAQVSKLLEQEGIRRDEHLDYICAMFDESFTVVATGSCFGNTLRCFAVSSSHQGEGLLNQIVTHLMTVQLERGNTRLFLYTKISTASFFSDLGFYEIARVDNTLVFMKNRRNGFAGYLKALSQHKGGRSAAIVMNANPFTLGHQYLVEKAAAEWDAVHLFLVSEDASLVPFSVRKQLVQAGVSHLPNVHLHDTEPYIISNATFPSYFLKEKNDVIQGHALLDLAVFIQIARALGITCRYVGEEPTSRVTGLYNEIMRLELPKAGIECRVLPRFEIEGQPVSASAVRHALRDGDWLRLRRSVPAALGVKNGDVKMIKNARQ